METKLFRNNWPLIGMIYLPPLPGFKGFISIEKSINLALGELKKLQDAGFEAALIENENDKPHEVFASPEVIAAMTRIATELQKNAKSLELGVEILLNDPKASLASAYAAGCSFIRSDYFVDDMYRTEYGSMHIDPEGLIEYRKKINAEHIKFYTDIQVKYAHMKIPRSLIMSAKEAEEKGTNGIIISGNLTGEAPMLEELKLLKKQALKTPVIIGSGLNIDNIASLVPYADGAIVGTGIMDNGIINREKAFELKLKLKKLT